MNAEFYQGNRQRLYDSLPDHTLLLLFSGSSIRKTADENYPFYADRSFLYLTGIGQEHTVLMAEKDGEEVCIFNQEKKCLPQQALFQMDFMNEVPFRKRFSCVHCSALRPCPTRLCRKGYPFQPPRQDSQE